MYGTPVSVAEVTTDKVGLALAAPGVNEVSAISVPVEATAIATLSVLPSTMVVAVPLALLKVRTKVLVAIVPTAEVSVSAVLSVEEEIRGALKKLVRVLAGVSVASVRTVV